MPKVAAKFANFPKSDKSQFLETSKGHKILMVHTKQLMYSEVGQLHKNVNPSVKMLFSPYMHYTHIFDFLDN